jgi:hypothetical protein
MIELLRQFVSDDLEVVKGVENFRLCVLWCVWISQHFTLPSTTHGTAVLGLVPWLNVAAGQDSQEFGSRGSMDVR